jgi:hypothetical protein
MPIDRTTLGSRCASRAVTALSLAIGIALLVAGCSGGDDPESTPPATRLPTVEPTSTPAMSLGNVTWTTSLDDAGAPVDDLTSFPRNTEVIYAVVNVKNVVDGETLTASWSLDDVPIDAIASSVTLSTPSGSGWASFALTWEGESLWPVGTLQVTISGSSGASATGMIEIEST